MRARSSATIAAVDWVDPSWAEILLAAGIMIVVSYIAVGVGPRTIGRQHAEQVALLAAAPVSAFTTVLGPIPQLLIFVGNLIELLRRGASHPDIHMSLLVEMAAFAERAPADLRSADFVQRLRQCGAGGRRAVRCRLHEHRRPELAPRPPAVG